MGSIYGAACAIAIRPTNVALLPAFALALWPQPARLAGYLRVFAPPALAAGLLAAYNPAVFQSIAGGYQATAGNHWLGGLAGVLLSPGRGLFIYTPVALFALAAFTPRARASRRKHRPIVTMAAAFSIARLRSSMPS